MKNKSMLALDQECPLLSSSATTTHVWLDFEPAAACWAELLGSHTRSLSSSRCSEKMHILTHRSVDGGAFSRVFLITRIAGGTPPPPRSLPPV